MIYEYLLNIDLFKNKTHPGWVEKQITDFYNPNNKTFIGWSPNEGERDYYIPDSVVVLTKNELVERVLAIHANTPYARPYTKEEKNAIREEFKNTPEEERTIPLIRLLNRGVARTEEDVINWVESTFDELENPQA